MYCKLCKKHGKSNTFTKGCDRKREDVINEHLLTKDHQNSLEDSIMKKTMNNVLNLLLTKNSQKYMILLRIDYYLAREDLAFRKFESLIDLNISILNECLGGKNEKMQINYTNRPGLDNFICSISYIIERNMLEKARSSPTYSIMVDETFDISKHENLIIYTKYFDSKKNLYETNYLKNVMINDLTGKGLFSVVLDELKSKKLDLNKLCGIGTDGAASMIGIRKGMVSYFKELKPFMINVHCISHRLALANEKIKAKIPYLIDFIDIIADIYAFFCKSSIRNEELREFQKLFNEEELQILRMCETRWLSLYNCVVNLSKIMNSLLKVLETEMAKDNKTSKQYKPLYNQILTYQFQCFMNFLLDILSTVTKITKKFQKDKLELTDYCEDLDLLLLDLQTNFISQQTYGTNYQTFKKEFCN